MQSEILEEKKDELAKFKSGLSFSYYWMDVNFLPLIDVLQLQLWEM